MFTLLIKDVELKASVRDDPRELEKIKRMQIDKNFDNWLSAYTIYMGVILQAYPGQGSALVKYQDLIHRTYSEYSGAAWLCYDEWFHSRVAWIPHYHGIESTINSGHSAWAPPGQLQAGYGTRMEVTVITVSSSPGRRCAFLAVTIWALGRQSPPQDQDLSMASFLEHNGGYWDCVDELIFEAVRGTGGSWLAGGELSQG
ncbi:UNVERIFIED_CONTAM: hypothetical protein K2H54_049418 [Gekko kuhli]